MVEHQVLFTKIDNCLTVNLLVFDTIKEDGNKGEERIIVGDHFGV